MDLSSHSISDWILNHLKENKHVKDDILHWKCCSVFLTREQILYSTKSLEDFSDTYDQVLNELRSQMFIYYKADEIWRYGERDIPKNFKMATKCENKHKKIKCLYIIEFDNGCKFGISAKFKNRVRAYKNPWCRKILNCYIMQADDPLDIEKHLISVFKRHTIGKSKEFVNLSPMQIIKEAEAYYPTGIFEHFIH